MPLSLDVFNLESHNKEEWITMKVSVAMNLVELCLHSGETRDAALATLQVLSSSCGTILFCASFFYMFSEIKQLIALGISIHRNISYITVMELVNFLYV